MALPGDRTSGSAIDRTERTPVRARDQFGVWLRDRRRFRGGALRRAVWASGERGAAGPSCHDANFVQSHHTLRALGALGARVVTRALRREGFRPQRLLRRWFWSVDSSVKRALGFQRCR